METRSEQRKAPADVGAGVPGGNSCAPFPDSNSAVLSPSAVSSQSGASQPAHANSREARNHRLRPWRIIALDTAVESDNVPWSKAVARRAAPTTDRKRFSSLFRTSRRKRAPL